MHDTYKIRDLTQVRLLSDPLKLRILQAFAERARTTTEVAAALDENVTKLYRHVDALFDAGLLEVTDERRKRGTVERTFRAVGRRFEADHSLFVGEENRNGRHAAMEMLRAGEQEIVDAISRSADAGDQDTILVRVRCKATPARIAELHRSLCDWVDAAQQDGECTSPGAKEVGALIAFYPIAGR